MRDTRHYPLVWPERRCETLQVSSCDPALALSPPSPRYLFWTSSHGRWTRSPSRLSKPKSRPRPGCPARSATPAMRRTTIATTTGAQRMKARRVTTGVVEALTTITMIMRMTRIPNIEGVGIGVPVSCPSKCSVGRPGRPLRTETVPILVRGALREVLGVPIPVRRYWGRETSVVGHRCRD